MKKYFLLTIAVMLCALSVDAQYKMQVNLKNGQVSEFNVSDIENVTWQEQAEEWHDVGFYYDEQGNKVEGWAMLTDDYVTALFEVGNQTFPVRIQERTDIPGLFRLVNAYSDNYPVNEPGEWHTDKDYYIIIDATNPNQVYIPDFCETGMEWGYGMFGIWSYAGYFKSKGYTDDDVRDYFGTYANGVITFPVDALLISLAEYEDGTLYYSNRNGMFKLVLNPDLESVKVTGITLNMSSLSLTEGDTYTLSATVSPSNATDKSVIWSSSNPSVATVSSTGKVIAVNAGTATITATANDSSGVKATCSVTVKNLDMHNGHEYVDLGLPSGTKWATCNVGASSPEGYGGYYAWGETETKSYYDWSTYKWCKGSMTSLTKYCTDSAYGTIDNKMVLEPSDDVAHVKWGGNWRMPTDTEYEELLDNCTLIETTQNGVNGYKVTSDKNGNSIFLPVAGAYWDGGYDEESGSYWSKTLSSSDYYAYYFSLNNSCCLDYASRCYGRSVRAVFSESASTTVRVTSITLGKSSLSLTEGDTYTLSATVSPSNATDKSVTWKSSNTSVATVSTSGKVTAINAGTATITATANDGSGVKATCSVTVKSSEYEHNGHGYVDLGLPSGTKWATCNVGASSPEGYGGYYAWGETTTKSTYGWSNYKHGYKEEGALIHLTKYFGSDAKMVLESGDDVAHLMWGGNWRMPTSSEIKELLDNCTGTWCTQNGVNGYKVTSKKNGNSIFLPAAGYYLGNSLTSVGTEGDYWSSSLVSSNSIAAYSIIFNSSKWYMSSDLGMRYLGQSVRAVFSESAPSTIKVTGITLDKSSLSLTEGDTYTLSATVSPSNATDKSVTWKSSNTSVATVSTSGKVSAVNAGTATITATANDGSGVKATCSVTVKSSEYEHNGHGYVDLGLPSGTKWATCNVGATKPEYYGDFYSFGETSTKSSYTTSNYKYGTNPNIPDNIQGTSYDVAHAKWGGNWVMPTFTQIKELVNNCTFVWTSVNGVYGGKFIGPNGNSIFMPAGGSYNDGKYISEGTYGYYWSSIMAYRQNWGECEHLSFNSDKAILYKTTVTGTTRNNFCNGSDGHLVRPVMR